MKAVPIHVIGGGLAGCEAALQLARFGLPVFLHEMRPARQTPAHLTGKLAEIVCSNSLKSCDHATASGLLKLELEKLGCRLLAAAQRAAVPAGAALAVDRIHFSNEVEQLVAAEPAITVVRDEVTRMDISHCRRWVLATGPLTSIALQEQILQLVGAGGLHFFDAIAPTVSAASLDMSVLFRAARYNRGTADYLNAALDETTYRHFHRSLITAEKLVARDFDRDALFTGCQPLEEIAASGVDSLRFGPLRPVGLTDPRTGRRPFAVVQLRQENREGSLYGLVGFQTRLKTNEQKRVFRQIPGLAAADFVRLGQIHRNFYVDTPRCLDRRFALRRAPSVHLAGQITGVEGYVESIASGLVTAWLVAADVKGIDLPPWPPTTLIGALHCGFLFDTTSAPLKPMNVHFGLLPPLDRRIRAKRERRLAFTARSADDLHAFLASPGLRRLLAAKDGG